MTLIDGSEVNDDELSIHLVSSFLRQKASLTSDRSTIEFYFADIRWSPTFPTDNTIIDAISKLREQKAVQVVAPLYDDRLRSTPLIGYVLIVDLARIADVENTEEKQSSPNTSQQRYENNVLFLPLPDGSKATLDLSGSKNTRQVFEAFWQLRLQNPDRVLFSPEEVALEYQNISGDKDVTRRVISDRKGNIQKKISSNPHLRNRIKWNFDRTSQKWHFEVK